MTYRKLAEAAYGTYTAQAYSDGPVNSLQGFSLHLRVTPGVDLHDLLEEVMPDIANRGDFTLVASTPTATVWFLGVKDASNIDDLTFQQYVERALNELVQKLHAIDTGEYFTNPD